MRSDERFEVMRSEEGWEVIIIEEGCEGHEVRRKVRQREIKAFFSG